MEESGVKSGEIEKRKIQAGGGSNNGDKGDDKGGSGGGGLDVLGMTSRIVPIPADMQTLLPKQLESLLTTP